MKTLTSKKPSNLNKSAIKQYTPFVQIHRNKSMASSFLYTLLYATMICVLFIFQSLLNCCRQFPSGELKGEFYLACLPLVTEGVLQYTDVTQLVDVQPGIVFESVARQIIDSCPYMLLHFLLFLARLLELIYKLSALIGLFVYIAFEIASHNSETIIIQGARSVNGARSKSPYKKQGTLNLSSIVPKSKHILDASNVSSFSTSLLQGARHPLHSGTSQLYSSTKSRSRSKPNTREVREEGRGIYIRKVLVTPVSSFIRRLFRVDNKAANQVVDKAANGVPDKVPDRVPNRVPDQLFQEVKNDYVPLIGEDRNPVPVPPIKEAARPASDELIQDFVEPPAPRGLIEEVVEGVSIADNIDIDRNANAVVGGVASGLMGGLGN